MVNNENVSSEEILRFLVEHDNLSLNGVADEIMKKRKETVVKEVHPFAISHSKDGKYRTWIKVGSKKKQIVRVNRGDLIEYLYTYYINPSDCREYTLSTLYEEWIEYKKVHVEHTTVERVQRDWERYYANEQIINTPLSKLDKVTLDKWVHEIISEYGLTKHSYGNFSLIIRQMLDYAVDKNIVNTNVFNKIKVDKKRRLVPEFKKPDHTQVFSQQELKNLFDLAWDDFYSERYRVHKLTPLVVMFMFLTGTRIGEACAVKHIDIQGDILTVRRMVRNEGDIIDRTKGAYGERKVFLVPEALGVVNKAKEYQKKHNIKSEFIFSVDSKPIFRCSVAKAFYKYCDKLGIERKGSHKARKTFVSSLLDAGINVNTVRQLVGHVDERTTLNNYCYDRSSEDEIIGQMESALRC